MSNPNTPNSVELNPIDEWREKVDGAVKPSYFIVEKDGERFNKVAADKISATTYDLVMEAIGEDDLLTSRKEDTLEDVWQRNKGRNQLRAELREYFKGMKNV